MKRANPRDYQWAFFTQALETQDKETCILWPFSTMGAGYASVKDMASGRVMGGHRLACFIKHGPPPEKKLHAAHECGVSGCINPNHISWKTAKDNAKDKKIHGTNNDGERHGLSVLTNEQAAEIRQELAQSSRGAQAALARRYGVSVMTISNLARGKSYREVSQ
jgi:hypothetical protein